MMLYCLVRKEFVKNTPEEKVRQSLLARFIDELGYPAGLLVVEKKISELVYPSTRLPNRRVDILCYTPSTLKPLLLIECKAHSFSRRDEQQVLGYNYYVNAHFVSLVSSDRMKFFIAGRLHQDESFGSFPSYKTLLELQKKSLINFFLCYDEMKWRKKRMSSEPERSKNNKEQNANIPKEAEGQDLRSMVRDLEDLVKIALAAEKNEVAVSIGSFVEIHKKLMAIYKRIEEFRIEYTKTLAAFGLKPDDMKLTQEQIQELGPKDRKLFETLSTLQAVCEEAKERVHKSLQEAPNALKEIQEELKGKERETVRRKGKFKGVGGKKGWLPS